MMVIRKLYGAVDESSVKHIPEKNLEVYLGLMAGRQAGSQSEKIQAGFEVFKACVDQNIRFSIRGMQFFSKFNAILKPFFNYKVVLLNVKYCKAL